MELEYRAENACIRNNLYYVLSQLKVVLNGDEAHTLRIREDAIDCLTVTGEASIKNIEQTIGIPLIRMFDLHTISEYFPDIDTIEIEEHIMLQIITRSNHPLRHIFRVFPKLKTVYVLGTKSKCKYIKGEELTPMNTAFIESKDIKNLINSRFNKRIASPILHITKNKI